MPLLVSNGTKLMVGILRLVAGPRDRVTNVTVFRAVSYCRIRPNALLSEYVCVKISHLGTYLSLGRHHRIKDTMISSPCVI